MAVVVRWAHNPEIVVRILPATNTTNMKHNYTSELELKSLLIRIKNHRVGLGTSKNNIKINKYITWHTKIKCRTYDSIIKKNNIKKRLRSQIISLSETTYSDNSSYERFGEIILLMVKNILRKPNFSYLPYQDDFYSDAVFKILKYLHNFNHKLISKRSGVEVNAFAYISQIIHNSILFIINTKKKERENLKKIFEIERNNYDFDIKNYGFNDKNFYNIPEKWDSKTKIIKNIYLDEIKTSLVDELESHKEDIECINISNILNIFYPNDYEISFREYEKLKNILKKNVNLIRSGDEC
jgi:hypothetical protein